MEPRPTPAGASRRQVVAVALFTALYLLVAIPVALLSGNQEFVFYIVVMLVLIGVVAMVHAVVRLSVGVLWALSIWGALHMAGGLMPLPDGGVLYNLWLIPQRLKYDQVVHAYGFAVTTVVCWQALRPLLPARTPLRAPLVVCAAAGMGFGALNEVVEFAATRIVEETNVGDYANTGWDLVANLVGAVGAATWLALRERRHRREADAAATQPDA